VKIILTESIPSLGQIGDIVNVAPGYARNYLFPKRLALAAVEKNVRDLEHKKTILAEKREKFRQEMLSLAERLNRVKIALKRKVSEEDKLYGSVSATDILTVLENQGFELPRRSIQMDQPIKQLGEYTVSVRIDAHITAQVSVTVEKED
jgi:large subunit ribosomal protein L9